MYQLYGDGIHDDTKAIQELIDNSGNELRLDAPNVCYLISAPLELPSNFSLVLPRFAEVKLAKGSDCVMLKNKTCENIVKRKNRGVFDYVNIFDPDYYAENIEVRGGIWNYNNREQKENPFLEQLPNGKWHWHPNNRIQARNDPSDEVFEKMSYTGYIFLFYNAKNLRLSSMTLKDPASFAVTLDGVSYFTVDNIIFDFNYGNPLACNMDGIHLNGNCHYGLIENLKGACYDDLVALNADEGLGGPITNITVRGIYAEDCHSAVRLLSTDYPVKDIHISDVFGTYFQYCIGITRYYEPVNKGIFDNITLENIHVSKAERYDVYFHKNDWVYSLIHFDSDIIVKNIRISNLHRREYINTIPTFYIEKDAEIRTLILENITTENCKDDNPMPLMVNNGIIKKLYAKAIYVNGEEYELKI